MAPKVLIRRHRWPHTCRSITGSSTCVKHGVVQLLSPHPPPAAALRMANILVTPGLAVKMLPSPLSGSSSPAYARRTCERQKHGQHAQHVTDNAVCFWRRTPSGSRAGSGSALQAARGQQPAEVCVMRTTMGKLWESQSQRLSSSCPENLQHVPGGAGAPGTARPPHANGNWL